jgi:hypothetical protein
MEDQVQTDHEHPTATFDRMPRHDAREEPFFLRVTQLNVEEDKTYPHFNIPIFEGSEYLSIDAAAYMGVGCAFEIPTSAVKATIWVERIDPDTTWLNGVFFSDDGVMLRVFNMKIPSN